MRFPRIKFTEEYCCDYGNCHKQRHVELRIKHTYIALDLCFSHFLQFYTPLSPLGKDRFVEMDPPPSSYHPRMD